MRFFLAGLTAAAGTFALLCGLMCVTAGGSAGGGTIANLFAGLLFFGVCAVAVPVVLLLHVAGLLIGRKHLARLPLVGLLHTSFFFPLVPAVLLALAVVARLAVPNVWLFATIPLAYVLPLIGWLSLLDWALFSSERPPGRAVRIVLALLLSYGAWAYWPKVPWRKLIVATLAHVLVVTALILLLYWFWQPHRSLGPIPGEFVPYLGGLPVTLAVWGWAILDAARTGSDDLLEDPHRA